MGLLPFISVSHSHIHAQARRTVHTNAASTHHTYTQRYSHTRRLSQTRQANRHLLYTSADTQTNANTHTHIYSLLLSLSLFRSPALSVLSLQVWFPCTRSVSAVYREHHSLIPTGWQKNKCSHTEDKWCGRHSFCSPQDVCLCFTSGMLLQNI